MGTIRKPFTAEIVRGSQLQQVATSLAWNRPRKPEADKTAWKQPGRIAALVDGRTLIKIR